MKGLYKSLLRLILSGWSHPTDLSVCSLQSAQKGMADTGSKLGGGGGSPKCALPGWQYASSPLLVSYTITNAVIKRGSEPRQKARTSVPNAVSLICRVILGERQKVRHGLNY